MRLCRNNPHPYITALENRVDCWPALLLEIDDFIQQAAERNEPAYVTMLAPFLRYLYCEPQRQPQHALLRHGLLRVLMPSHPAAGSLLQNKEQDPVFESLLHCLCQLVPHMQVDSVEAVLEFCGFVDALLQVLVPAPEQWRSERVGLTLQLLCACRRCLRLNADCRPLLNLLQQLLPACQQELPLDELLMGMALLLLEVPATQQTSLLNLALSLVPEHGELAPWLSPVLVLPVLQLLSCLGLTEALADQRRHRLNQDLAHSLLRRISRETDKLSQSSPPLALPLSSWYNELSVALSVLRRVTEDPAAAADWLLSVSSALSSGQSQLCSLSLMVTHLLLTGGEDVCQLALKAIQALAAAEPCQ
ncbi:focadhesin-like, partial [Notothenia coriiceps]|uniref:Focadhesin-like n=1 Tax=Notothenia coriiceps TaxID=8208 RepID=A0A6I9Q0R2_9TELE